MACDNNPTESVKMAKRETIEALLVRDQKSLAALTAEDWLEFAGKVLAIDPKTDKILCYASSEDELEEKLKCEAGVVEFFHVPKANSIGK